jgi:predicted nucleic acid-binding protein
MRAAFLDTVGLLALWDESDQWHESASRAYDLLTSSPVRLLTSSFVLLECGNAAARRPYRKDVADLWHALEQSGDLIHHTAEQVAAAWASYPTHPVGSAGIVDLVSFSVMRDLGIQLAFTNDAHFKAAGFQPLMN